MMQKQQNKRDYRTVHNCDDNDKTWQSPVAAAAVVNPLLPLHRSRTAPLSHESVRARSRLVNPVPLLLPLP